MTNEDEKEALRQRVAKQIEEAFADTPYPGDNNIGWGCGWEGAEFEEVLRGKHWKDLTQKFIFQHRGEIPCMTPAGFRFYLPAFMLATLNYYSEMDTLPGNLIFNLTFSQTKDKNHDEHLSVRTTSFNRAEQKAILAFLGTYLPLHPEDFEYGKWESPYKAMLEDAIMFWKNKLDAASDAG